MACSGSPRPPRAAPQLLPYAKNQYVRYHGSEDGFDALLATAKTAATIPAGFTVAPAPSPADQAADDAQEEARRRNSPSPSGSSFLPTAARMPVDQVWNAIKGKQVQLVAVVIEAARDSLKLAGSVDDIDAKKADITLKLKEPLAAARVPKAGDAAYHSRRSQRVTRAGDNFNLTFTDGEVLKGLPEAAKKPAAGVHHKADSNQDGRNRQIKEGRPMCRPSCYVACFREAGCAGRLGCAMALTRDLASP